METVFPSFLSAVDRPSWFLLALFTSWIVSSADTKQTSWPLHSKNPVLFVWNAPTEDCETQHSVTLSLDLFDIVSSPSKGFARQNLTTFYNERLGLYPYLNNKHGNTAVNGGLPQSVNLTQHLKKMSQDLDTYIPDPKAKGLTVINWDRWHPLWSRNYVGRNIHRTKSLELVARKDPSLTEEQMKNSALKEFELSARELMLGTLRQGKKLRPNQLWGFHMFPECFNTNYDEENLDIYTGRCRPHKIEENNQLNWLLNESTALFPEIYLEHVLASKDVARLYVQKRVQYTMRIASFGDGLARPVFVYSRPAYRNNMKLLPKKDLVNTIGESVALGAAGVIFWGDEYYASKSGCSDLNNYFRGDMGRYLLNVTTAAKECSQKLCNFNGRCLRREPDSTMFLHLNPSTHSIISQNGKLKVTGYPGEAEQKAFRQHFKCQCYTGTKGENCKMGGQGEEAGEKGERGQSSATSVLGMWPLCFVLQLGLLSLFH